jgi:hypothetical protein
MLMGAMTLVEARYRFTAPFQEEFTSAIQSAHSEYGVRGVKLDPKLEGLTVLYDASRLTPEDLDHTMRRLALPVERIKQ